MKINWRVRVKNPTFWVQVGAVVVTPLLAAAGVAWEQITSWPELGRILLDGLSQPVLVVGIAAGLWGVINDPTTSGLCDSAETMAAEAPRANVSRRAAPPSP